MSSSPEDASLSPLQSAAREGNLGTWSEEVWRKIDAYLPKLKAFVARKSFDSRMGYENEDVTQQVVLDAIEASRKGLQEPTYVPTYLQKMATNEIFERLRKGRVPETGEKRNIAFESSEKQDAFLKGIEGRRENLIATLQVQEVQRRVDRMGRDYRKVFDVYILGDRSLAETAEILDRSENAIKGLAFRLRKNLKKYAQANGFEHCKLRETGTESPWTEQEAERRKDSTPQQPGV